MFYMGFTEPSSHFSQNTVLMKIWISCKRMSELVDVYIKQRLCDTSDIYDFLIGRILDKMPTLTADEFSDILEPILLLDTINRIVNT